MLIIREFPKSIVSLCQQYEGVGFTLRLNSKIIGEITILKAEFKKKVGMQVSDAEFESINNVYTNSDNNIDKDKFCKVWASLNRNRIVKYKEEGKNKKNE